MQLVLGTEGCTAEARNEPLERGDAPSLDKVPTMSDAEAAIITLWGGRLSSAHWP